ncbi:MAG: tRNA (guanosine(37)-N1)-methyltransferase TrmD [Emergencia timonensis]|uniref:tRNA (guanosine(37)-N1)-methyltransferase TrmD n=1 Tax=Emergencia timonensis TaxID=1776384 RepID=UPI000835BFA1|nr:tRNA (guanosine(37)-N1)-methyltransferase TrmD [Emergencia timonensis]WNX90290.1 tRNA (guanosine(37)-N1)-methyltransferase TrmD [Emergencia timonensis]
MKINVLTLFPEMFTAVTGSILGRACEKGIITFNFINIRDFSNDKHKKVDDYPFGGGPGMVMMADPIFGALNSIDARGKKILYMSPRGNILDQTKIQQLAEEEELTILCGHYEGVDQRVLDHFDMEEVSIGDYILTGGELPAMVLIDTVARLIPGVLAGEDSATEESIYSGLLEYPQYTKPRSYEGMDVPEILVGGNHKLIYLWKFEQSLRLTREMRPDLFEEFVKNSKKLTKDEHKVLEKVLK